MSVTVCIWMSDDDEGVAACHPSSSLVHTPGSTAWELAVIVSTPFAGGSLALPPQSLHASEDSALCSV